MDINFSISLITKDSAKTLPRLLDSLKEFFLKGGEVCVLDTGSTDNTVEIARQYDCVVNEAGSEFVETFEGITYFNFSKARNRADFFASNDMILSLDSDEVVTNLDIGLIENLINRGFNKFEHIQIFTHDSEGGPDIQFIQSKFYNRRKFHWENRVHEMLVGEGKKYRLSEKVLRIDHWQNTETNRTGYIKGLSVDCKLNPTNDRNCHYYARELFYAGRGDEALKEFERHLSMKLPPKEFDTTPTHMESMIFIGNIYGISGDLAKELEWYEKARQEDPTHRNVIVRIAQFYKWHNNKEMAKKYADEASKFEWDEKYGVSRKHFLDEVSEIQRWASKGIPKRIISMWIGGEMPESVKECVATHKQPGYEHLWVDNSNYHEFDCKYLDECISSKNYGKASDFLRMCYLEKYGGIYLDADTKIIKSFDDVLDNELFVCEERNYFIANGIVGAIPHHPLVVEYLGKLQRNFRGDGELIFQPGMGLWTEIIKQEGWVDKIKIYPPEWFLPYDWQSGVTSITENTHTVHLYLRSWINNNK